MKHIAQWAIALVLVGCGASEDGAQEDGIWIGEMGEQLQSKISANYTYGVMRNEPHMACRGIPGEECVLPIKRAFKVCFDSTLPAQAKGWFTSSIAGVQSATANRFTFANLGNCPAGGGPTPTTDVIINGASTGLCGGSGGGFMEDYSCQNFSLVPNSAQLSDPFPGTYWPQAKSGSADPGHVASILHIDYGDVLAKGANTTEDNALGLHAAEYQVWALIGIGGRDDVSLTMTSHQISPLATVRVEGTAGERCRAQSFNVNDTTSYRVITPNCTSD